MLELVIVVVIWTWVTMVGLYNLLLKIVKGVVLVEHFVVGGAVLLVVVVQAVLVVVDVVQAIAAAVLPSGASGVTRDCAGGSAIGVVKGCGYCCWLLELADAVLECIVGVGGVEEGVLVGVVFGVVVVGCVGSSEGRLRLF
eukprot:277867-Karenia_brevis.AAC.1